VSFVVIQSILIAHDRVYHRLRLLRMTNDEVMLRTWRSRCHTIMTSTSRQRDAFNSSLRSRLGTRANFFDLNRDLSTALLDDERIAFS